MYYRITITKSETVRKERRQEWAVVGHEPIDEGVAARILHKAQEGVIVNIQGDAKYGYTPPLVVEAVEENKIFEQSVESLDLPAVIKAINGI